MRGLSLGLSLGVGVACVVVACAGKTGSGAGDRPINTAGAPSTVTAGQAGSAPIFMGSGGTGPVLDVTSAAGMDAGSDAPVEASTCDDLTIQTYETVPTVLLLVDTSGSMFQPRDQLWYPLYKALTDPTKGVIAMLQDKVRFGFTSYTATSAATCPTLINTD